MPERAPDLARREFLIRAGLGGLSAIAVYTALAVGLDIIHNRQLTADTAAQRLAYLDRWATASVAEHHDQTPAPVGSFSERLIERIRDSTLITVVTFTKNGASEVAQSTSFLTHPNKPVSVRNETFLAMTAHGLTADGTYSLQDIDTISVGRPYRDAQMYVFDKGNFTASISPAYDGSGRTSNLSHDVGLVRFHNTPAIAALTTQSLDYASNAPHFRPGTQLLAVGYPGEVVGPDPPANSQAFYNVARLQTTKDNLGFVNLVIDDGMSGTPLVSNSGEVVAMAVAATDKVYDQAIVIGLQDLDALFAKV